MLHELLILALVTLDLKSN